MKATTLISITLIMLLIFSIIPNGISKAIPEDDTTQKATTKGYSDADIFRGLPPKCVTISTKKGPKKRCNKGR